jgi:hypothetical protein
MLPEGPSFTIGAKVLDIATAEALRNNIGGPGEYEVVDAGGMALEGPAWTIGARRTDVEGSQASSSPGEASAVK